MRQFDLIVFGATSFVGKLVVQHILETHGVGRGLSWAIAGRSNTKLNDVLRRHGDAASHVAVLVADANNLDELKAMCVQAKVVITTAGPYSLYGEKLVQACAQTGTDYCDITGEVPWVVEMIARHEKTAQQTGARLVSFCGFDSIPSDMGVYYLQREAQRRFRSACTSVRMRVLYARGNPPGGTYASLVHAISEASHSKTYRAALADPYVLCAPDHEFRVKQNEAYLPTFDSEFEQWSAAFVMAGINTRVVHRSNSLLGNPYGTQFRYEEALLVGRSLPGRVAAYAVTGGLASFVALVATPMTRTLLQRFILPKPGEGSDLNRLAACRYDVRFTGEAVSGEKIHVRVKGQGDPACFATSRMLSEAGICLAHDVSKADKPGGFWTTASLCGDKLIGRLQQHAKMQFDVL